MSCGGRIYKGDAIYVSVPFDIEDYSALTISYFTSGEYNVVRTEDEVTIEDGFITAYFEGHDLDLLPDGVLRYTITCEVEGEDYVDSNNTMFYLKTPKDYDAETAEEVYEDGYDSGYTEGYSSGLTMGFPVGYQSGATDGRIEGIAEQKAKLVSTAITANGTYSREDGFNLIDVNVPSGGSGSYESGWTDGFASGHTDGIAEQKAKLISTAVTVNGTYSREDGFSSIEVNVPGSTLASGDVDMVSIQQTFGKNDLRPTAPSGETVYGGSVPSLIDYINQNGGLIQIKRWTDEQHNNYQLEAIIRNEGLWVAYQSGNAYHFDEIPSAWTLLSDLMYAKYSGTDLYFYWDYPYGAFFTDAHDVPLPSEELIIDSNDGISAITVNAQSIFDSGYTSGYTDGVANAPLITSCWIRFTGQQPISREDVLSIRTGNGENFNDFVLQDKRVWSSTSYTYIDFYGYTTSHIAIDTIEITIPTSVYSQWSSAYSNALNINHSYGMSNGIFGEARPYPTIVDNGDGTTSIRVGLSYL